MVYVRPSRDCTTVPSVGMQAGLGALVQRLLQHSRTRTPCTSHFSATISMNNQNYNTIMLNKSLFKENLHRAELAKDSLDYKIF